MAHATMTYREIRFVIEDELTHCYVLLEAGGDAPIGVQGWHHKAFPSSASALDILREHVRESVMWPQKAPK